MAEACKASAMLSPRTAVPHEASVLTMDTNNADFHLLHEVPPEVLLLVLSKFCDGKSLSTLALALAVSSDPFCQETAWYTVPMVVQRKLLAIAALLEENGSPDDVANTAGAASWIASIASTCATVVDVSVAKEERIRLLSENLAVLDFLQQSLSLYSVVDKGHFEWPVWCGRISFDSTVNETRMQNTAALVLTAPMQYPYFIPGAHSVFQNHIPTAAFQCEPQNRKPIPPWGRVRALPGDASVLAPVVERLEQWDQVASPTSVVRSADTLNVAILTQKQAKNRTIDMIWRPRKSSWILEQNEGLIFCWHDDSGEGLISPRDYVSFVIQLMKVRDRLEAE